MLSHERAFKLFEAHAKATPCKVCQEVYADGHVLITCPCGWNLTNAEIASDSPDTDVVAIGVVDKLELDGWAFYETSIGKNGRISHGTPPVSFIDRITQLSIGTLDGTKLYVMLFNMNGFIRGKMLSERTIDSVFAKITELAADMRSLNDHDVEDAVAEAAAKLERK